MWGRGRAATGAGAATATEAIVAEISAQEIGGQIAVGSHNVQVHAEHGAIVTVAAPARVPAVRAREAPVALLPRDAPGLLGREREIAAALDALAGGESVALTAPPGMGKTSLLRRLAHAGEHGLEHGVVFTRAAGQPVADVERFIFDALYEADGPYVPTPAELRMRLADRRALVVLDDVAPDRDDLCALLDAAPACRFLLACERRCLSGEGRELALGGLAPADALALLERELGRPLREDERPRAVVLCERLGGRPLSVVQAAALARAGELPSVGGPGELERALDDDLDDEERRVVDALELLAPAAVHVDDVAAIAGVPDAAAVLERLRTVGAAQAHSPRWTATLGGLTRAPDPDAELARRACARMSVAAAERPLEDVPVLLAALRAGAATRCFDGVLALAHAADPLLTRSGRWAAWGDMLAGARRAAEATGDRVAAAWALHQLGTRAGLLGDERGRAQLEQALALRRELGDRTGAAVTAHNLGLLFGGGPPDGDGQHGGGNGFGGGSFPAGWLALGGLVLALGVVAALLLSSQGSAPGKPSASGTSTRTTTTGPPPTNTGRGGGGGGGHGPTGGTGGGGDGGRGGSDGGRGHPRPALPRLSLDADLSFVTYPIRVGPTAYVPAYKGPDPTRVHSVSVVDLGPGEIAVVPSVDNTAFETRDVDCGQQPLPVGKACTFLLVFRGNASTSGTLSFKGSPTTAPLSATVTTRTQPTTTTETAPPPTTTASGSR